MLLVIRFDKLRMDFYILQEKLPPTDSRLRPDQRCLENGEYEMANAEKLRLEQRQRQVTFLELGSVIHNSSLHEFIHKYCGLRHLVV